MITLAPQVAYALSTQEREVSGDTRFGSAAREISEFLASLLTVQDGSPQCGSVKPLPVNGLVHVASAVGCAHCE
jgi:hypothetical protein